MSDLHRRTELLAEIAARYGTPTYVYALDEVRRAADALRSTLPAPTSLYYSLKANSHPEVVGTLAAAGLHMEVCSTGEVACVLRAGVPAHCCLYTGPAKTSQELAYAIGNGVRLFSVESPVDLARLEIAADAAGCEVDYMVRLNADAPGTASGLRMTGAATQFGVDLADLDTLAGLLKPRVAAHFAGVHLFSASNIPSGPDQVAEFAHNLRAALWVAEHFGVVLRFVSLGGGFAAPFAQPGARTIDPGSATVLAALLDDELPGWRAGEPQIAFESGRALSGECGVLLSTVMDVKSAAGRRFVVLDAGVNSLGGMSGLGRLLVPSATPIVVSGATGEPQQVTLTGPLCTPLDVHNRQLMMAVPEAGSVVAVPNVGAYGLTASLVGFLGRPIAAEVIVDGDHLLSARRLSLVETEL